MAQGRAALQFGAIMIALAAGCAGTTAHSPPRAWVVTGDHIDPERGAVQTLWLRRLFETAQWDRAPIVLTVHEIHAQEWRTFDFSAFTITSAGPRLDSRVTLGGEYWQTPVLFSDANDQFALFEVRSGGSATYRSCALIWLCEDGARQIPIESPVAALAHLIAPEQHSDAGRASIRLEAGRPTFNFSIWNAGEHNNFPTGGSVSGVMGIDRDATGTPMRLVVDQWDFSKSAVPEGEAGIVPAVREVPASSFP